ncbi:MAG: hypothetical protein RR311_11990 [Comamonas sp.]
MTHQSLADKAVDAIAAVRAMGEGLGMEHPERHAVRDLKRAAEAILETALHQARGLAYTAEGLSTDMRKEEAARAEASKAAP